MRCAYCHERAGILKKICPLCRRVVAVIQRSAGHVGWTELVDRFAAEHLTRERVDLVLDAEIAGRPALRDWLTSEMANVLMRGLGMPGRQSPADVQRIRRSAAAGQGEGVWRAGEPSPEDARTWTRSDESPATSGVGKSRRRGRASDG